MGSGTRKNPYTREDVLRLIKKHGGTAKGLDLSEKVFEEGIDLRKLDLEEIILNKAVLRYAHLEGADLSFAQLEEADLFFAHLEGANLWQAHLEGASLSGARLEETDFLGAHLEGADLSVAHLEGADLRESHIEGADLRYAQFSTDTKLEDVNWGNYILGEERIREEEFRRESFEIATATYRRLKTWHKEHGLYDIAAKFYYREMEVKRKTQSWKKEPHLKLWSWVLRILCGYGEKPERVVISAATIVFGLAIAYFLWGSFSSTSFWDTLYYSVASFTALGYGQWAPQPTGWAKGVGAAEAVIGVSMIALFLVTFTRKLTR